MIGCGAGRFIVRDERDALVASGVSFARAYELVHDGCRFCEAGENHTNDAVRLARSGNRPRATSIVESGSCPADRLFAPHGGRHFGLWRFR
jgi:hypothetical protein